MNNLSGVVDLLLFIILGMNCFYYIKVRGMAKKLSFVTPLLITNFFLSYVATRLSLMCIHTKLKIISTIKSSPVRN